MSSTSSLAPTLPALSDDQLPAATRETLDGLRRALGMVPNLHRTLAHAPAALQAYTGTAAALAGGRLDPELRERIAVTCAAQNGCRYCASAHTLLGSKLGLDADELARNQRGESSDPRAAAALLLVVELLAHRGRVPAPVIEGVREAGFDDGEIAEIVAHVGMNSFSNLFNEFARTEIDFPLVELAP